MGATFKGKMNQSFAETREVNMGGSYLISYITTTPQLFGESVKSSKIDAKNKFLNVPTPVTLSNQAIEVCTFTQTLMRGYYPQCIIFIQ